MPSTSVCNSRNGLGDISLRPNRERPYRYSSPRSQRLELQEGLRAQKAEPPHLLAADHTLKQKLKGADRSTARTPTQASNHHRLTVGKRECTRPCPTARKLLHKSDDIESSAAFFRQAFRLSPQCMYITSPGRVEQDDARGSRRPNPRTGNRPSDPVERPNPAAASNSGCGIQVR